MDRGLVDVAEAGTVPAELAGDVSDEFQEEFGAVAGLLVDQSEPDEELSDETADSEAERALAAAAPIPRPWYAESADAARVDQDKKGDTTVWCGLLPWSQWERHGRITTWPKNIPEARRSVSIKCYFHGGNCGSPAKGRTKVSDLYLKQWLYMAEVEAYALPATLAEQAKRHRAAWDTVIAPLLAQQHSQVLAVPAASSSAAASSSGALPSGR